MSGTNRLTIGIDFDLVCPWCFIGKRQLALARARFSQQYPGVVVVPEWHGVQLLPDVPDDGLPFARFYEQRLGSPEAVRHRQQQVASAARGAGLELDLANIARMPNTARAHRLLRHVARLGPPALYETVLERLFAAYFQRGEDLGDPATLRRIAAAFGVHGDPATGGLADLPSPAHDIAGVPLFSIGRGAALSGARDAGTLFDAMRRALSPPAPSP